MNYTRRCKPGKRMPSESRSRECCYIQNEYDQALMDLLRDYFYHKPENELEEFREIIQGKETELHIVYRNGK